MTYNPPDPHLHIHWLDKPLAECQNCGKHPAQYHSQNQPGAKLLWCTHCNTPKPPTNPNHRCPGCTNHKLHPCYPGCRT